MSSVREENHLKNQHDFSVFQYTRSITFSAKRAKFYGRLKYSSYNFDTTRIDTIEIVLTYLSLLPIIDISRSNFLV